MTGGIKSPYWETSKQDIVWTMDDLFDTRRYLNIQHFADTLRETFVKNPEEFKFYLGVLEDRVLLVKQVMLENSIN